MDLTRPLPRYTGYTDFSYRSMFSIPYEASITSKLDYSYKRYAAIFDLIDSRCANLIKIRTDIVEAACNKYNSLNTSVPISQVYIPNEIACTSEPTTFSQSTQTNIEESPVYAVSQAKSLSAYITEQIALNSSPIELIRSVCQALPTTHPHLASLMKGMLEVINCDDAEMQRTKVALGLLETQNNFYCAQQKELEVEYQNLLKERDSLAEKLAEKEKPYAQIPPPPPPPPPSRLPPVIDYSDSSALSLQYDINNAPIVPLGANSYVTDSSSNSELPFSPSEHRKAQTRYLFYPIRNQIRPSFVPLLEIEKVPPPEFSDQETAQIEENKSYSSSSAIYESSAASVDSDQLSTHFNIPQEISPPAHEIDVAIPFIANNTQNRRQRMGSTTLPSWHPDIKATRMLSICTEEDGQEYSSSGDNNPEIATILDSI